MKKYNSVPNKIYLEETDLPKKWYNVVADMPNKPAPPLNPATKKPLLPDDLADIFPKYLIEQEMSEERYIDIPDEVMAMYKSFRPSPLCRAYKLEKALDTPAHIYYKYEGNNPSGSHKLNSAIPQAYYNKLAGMKRLATETGAGQWGTALSIACSYYGLECTVYMVKVSAEQKPYRKIIMETYGAEVISSPSSLTEAGRKILEEYPDSSGSLGIAISEAVDDAARRNDTNYALGSVLNHVVLHQTIIGMEAKKQFELIGEYPDMIIGACGGGSNFSGIAFPFMPDKLKDRKDIRFIGVEPSACPTLTRGKFAYDYGDTAMVSPIVKMYTLGHAFMPPGIHSGGLRYHGMSALVSQLYHDGYIEARSVKQTEIFKAALTFAKNEVLLPAPESSHAIAAVIDEALKCKETGEEKVILFSLSGNGYFDMMAYQDYLEGNISNIEYSDDELKEIYSKIPDIPE